MSPEDPAADLTNSVEEKPEEDHAATLATHWTVASTVKLVGLLLALMLRDVEGCLMTISSRSLVF